MTESFSITIRRNEDGRIDVWDAIRQFESGLDDEAKITDHVDIAMLLNDYPDLTVEQARCAVGNIDIGDYDDAIDHDQAADVIESAVLFATRDETPDKVIGFDY